MLPDSPVFSIPETQDIPPTGRGGGCGGARDGNRRKKATRGASSSSQPSQTKPEEVPKRQTKKWTMFENETLVRAWMEISEDKKAVGDYQKSRILWSKIRELFYKTVGNKACSENFVSGKWTEIQKNVGLFTNIYNRNANRMRASGSDDLPVYQFTCEE